jgi:hypothetical protein
MSLHVHMDVPYHSPYELLFGRKPQTMLPSTGRLLKSRHPQDAHQEANQQRQVKQAEFYNRRSGNDRRILRNKEPVFVSDTLRNIWKPAVVLNTSTDTTP